MINGTSNIFLLPFSWETISKKEKMQNIQNHNKILKIFDQTYIQYSHYYQLYNLHKLFDMHGFISVISYEH